MNGIPPLSSRDAHASPPQRVLERLHSSAAGLDADEAARRLAAHGYNRLPAPKRQGPLLRLLRQFHNVLLYMMLFASLVTALLGFWVDSAVILLAVVVNALIGFVQEGKAANALDAIRDMFRCMPWSCATASARRWTPNAWYRATWCCWLPATGCRPTCGCSKRRTSMSTSRP